jgi:hypothetical protein
MSRQNTTIRSAIVLSACGGLHEVLEHPVADRHVLELQAEFVCGRPRTLQADRIVGLGEVHDAAIIAEIERQELRMTVDAQALPDQRVELPGQEVGQPEGADLLLRQLREPVEPGEERIAMDSVDPLHAFLGQHPVELAAGAAVAIGDQDALMVRTMPPDRVPDGARNELRLVVQLRRQAVQLHVRQSVRLDQRQDFARQCPAGEDQGPDRRAHDRLLPRFAAQAAAPRWLCLRAMNSLAVSTATAASRQ